jgi:DNA excision repair protein ERCC-3
MSSSSNPLIVQGDFTLLLEVDHPSYPMARDGISRFAELVKSPEYIHTYCITPLSIWNASAAGMTADEMEEILDRFSRYPIAPHVRLELRDLASRYGRVTLFRRDEQLILQTDESWIAEQIWGQDSVRKFIGTRLSATSFLVADIQRGRLKQALIKVGFPAEDLAGYHDGDRVEMHLNNVLSSQQPFVLRSYQIDAVEIFHADGGLKGGSGVVVLPCGAGKTVVGISVMAKLQTSTVIITTGVTASRQWISEILDKTSIAPEDVGEYSGEIKQIRPITVTTYQILVHRRRKEEIFPHFRLFDRRNWGLIIYDEVHLLPAPVFQITAELQARRRLGLTATLIREDDKQDDVFALIGPKKYDVPWKELEAQGWIAEATCTEVRVGMTPELRMRVAQANKRNQFRIASENPDKLAVIPTILARHPGEPALIIGMYLEQLQVVADTLKAPILTGATTAKKRDELYAAFRRRDIDVLVVSKVANFAVDLPDASVALQISGTFGSRQEEAQRLGRLLRPKPGHNQAHFYSLVSRDSVEQDFAFRRQRFLIEQGYAYEIVDGEEL